MAELSLLDEILLSATDRTVAKVIDFTFHKLDKTEPTFDWILPRIIEMLKQCVGHMSANPFEKAEWIKAAFVLLDYSLYSDTADQLRNRVKELEEGIREHRDSRGDDRCYRNNHKLYALLPEGYAAADLRTCEPFEMIQNCMAFIISERNPTRPYVSPQREIERLEKLLLEVQNENDRLRQLYDAYSNKEGAD